MSVIQNLEKIQQDIVAFLKLHNNPYDTSKLNKKAEKLQKLLDFLKRTPSVVEPTTAQDMSDSVGKGGNNDAADVRWVQTRLNVNGASLRVDGDCGPVTQGAIGAYQGRNNLPQSQLIEPGDETYRLLGGQQSGQTDDTTGDDTTTDDTHNTPSTLSDSVGKGGNNDADDVRWVQTELNNNGASLRVDGDCGPVTQGAIGAYQGRNNLPQSQLIEPGDATHLALEGKEHSDDNNTTDDTGNTTDDTPNTPITNASIKESVGKDGVNQPDDVRTVQSLLKNNWDYSISINGEADDSTIQAIRQFQHRYAGMIRSQDARVDPNGTTWQYLVGDLKPAMEKTTDSIMGGVETDMEKKMGEFTQAFSGIRVEVAPGEFVTVRPPYHINLGDRKRNAEAIRARNPRVQRVADSLGYFAKAGKATPSEIQTFLQTCLDQNLVRDKTSQGMHEFLSTYGISADCSGLAVQAANFLIEGDMERPNGASGETVPIMNTGSIQQHPEVGSPAQLRAGDMMVNYKREGTNTYHVRVIVDVDIEGDEVSFTTVESTGSSTAGDGGDGVGQRRWKFLTRNSFDNLQALVGNNWSVASRSNQAYIYVRLRQMQHLEDN